MEITQEVNQRLTQAEFKWRFDMQFLVGRGEGPFLCSNCECLGMFGVFSVIKEPENTE